MSQAFRKDQIMLAQAVHNHYRCPEEFLDFRLNEGISPDPGYFQFGPGVTCFGRSLKSALKAQVASSLYCHLILMKSSTIFGWSAITASNYVDMSTRSRRSTTGSAPLRTAHCADSFRNSGPPTGRRDNSRIGPLTPPSRVFAKTCCCSRCESAAPIVFHSYGFGLMALAAASR